MSTIRVVCRLKSIHFGAGILRSLLEVIHNEQQDPRCHESGQGSVSKLGHSLWGAASVRTASSLGVVEQDRETTLACEFQKTEWRLHDSDHETTGRKSKHPPVVPRCTSTGRLPRPPTSWGRSRPRPRPAECEARCRRADR